MHLYAFVQAAEIWVKTESHWRGCLRMDGLTPLGTAKRSKVKWTEDGCHLRNSSSHCRGSGGEISSTLKKNEKKRMKRGSEALRVALCGAQWSGSFYTRRATRRGGFWRATSRSVMEWKCLLCGETRERERERKTSSWSPTQQRIICCASFPAGAASSMCRDLHRCEWTRVHPITTPTSWRCWISPEAHPWHHRYRLGFFPSVSNAFY